MSRPTKYNGQPTAQEKEWLERPFCLYDTIHIEICLHHTFPPTKEFCRECLIKTIIGAIEDGDSSATRWFVYFLNFLNEEKQ